MSAGGKKWPTYALLDTGANCSAITDDVLTKIDAPLKTLNIRLGTFDNNTVSQREVASFTVSNLSETFHISVNNALIGNMLCTSSEKPPKAADYQQFDHLKNLTFNTLDDDSIGLLLDAKHAHAFMTGRVYMGAEGEPIGIETFFGNSVIGPKPDDGEQVLVNTDLGNLDVESDVFTDEIRRLFRHDFISKEAERFPSEMTHPSVNDELSLEQLNATVKFNEQSKHYTVGLPWRLGRSETAKLFRSIDFFSAAQNRHEKLRKKFEKNPTLRAGSFAQMEEKIEKGYIKKIESLDASDDSPVCYLPIHVALHPEKPNKFRLCMDGAARVGPHYLNKYLFNGPDYFNRLVSVLFKFRQKRFTLTGDIQDFFYQVECDPLDRPALRCMWWNDENMSETVIYEALVHIFGATSSPTVAHFVLRHHAKIIKDKYPPNVAWAILNLMYVDDMLASTDTREEARELKENLTKALAEGGFKILKWRSNIPDLSEEADSVTTSFSAPSQEPANCDVNPSGGALIGDDVTQKSEGITLNPVEVRRLNGQGAQNSPPGQPTLTLPIDGDEEMDPNDLVSTLSNDWEVAQAKELLNETPDKILGVGYDYETDEIAVRVKDKHFKNVSTKREVLSWISSVYDPLGIVAPYILKGRHFFQLINETGISWNDPVPEHILTPFNQWKDKVIHLRQLRIPRWTNPLGLENSKTELVTFCDAGCWGYGHCSYIRRSLQGGGDQISVSLLIGKAHVVPLSMMRNPTENAIPHGDSIPRLELNAARGAAEYRDMILRESGETFDDVYMFSDSLTVLNWLNNFEKRFKTYENFRIKSIRALSRLSEWRHCPTNLNPADLCSKAIEANDYKKWDFYHYGPSFLLSPISQWPPSRPMKETEAESCDIQIGAIHGEAEKETINFSPVELLFVGATTEEPKIEIDLKPRAPWPLEVSAKTERWEKKIRLIAMVRKVILTLRDKIRTRKENLTATRLRPRPKENSKKTRLTVVFTEEEKEKAEYLLVSAIQSQHFEKEIVSLVTHGVFTPNAISELKVKNSPLTFLSPFIDEHNVMRASGRCRKAEYLPYDSRFPIILPNYKNENTRSLIMHYHTKTMLMHMPQNETHHLLRERYFILGGKTSVSFVINRCLLCQRLSKNPLKQREGDLPPERMEAAIPFKNSGLDVYGPYYLRHSGRGTQKRFVLMVCCMSVRAVALFPLKNMTSSAVVNALIRMNAQYPGLKNIFSDNGSNFRGADREIREAVAAWNKDELNLELDKVGITWTFGPASCGSAGGAWERLIGMTKKLIQSVIGDKTIDTDDFDTLIAGAAAIMNRRPMMQVSADIDEPLVLSPAHFLHPYVFTNSATNIMPPNSGEPETLKSGWRATQHLLDLFFTRFKREYLASLLKRKETKSSLVSPKAGDVVILKEDDLPREQWRLCRITEVINADKNHPRRFLLRDSKNKILDRNINGFIPLELHD